MFSKTLAMARVRRRQRDNGVGAAAGLAGIELHNRRDYSGRWRDTSLTARESGFAKQAKGGIEMINTRMLVLAVAGAIACGSSCKPRHIPDRLDRPALGSGGDHRRGRAQDWQFSPVRSMQAAASWSEARSRRL